MKSPLRVERERRGWTIEEVAVKLGVSGAQVSRIETDGVRSASLPRRMVKLFGHAVTLDQVCAPDEYAEAINGGARTATSSVRQVEA